MPTTTLARLGLAVAGLYGAVGVLELMSDHQAEDGAVLSEPVDYALEVVFTVALAATVVALATLGYLAIRRSVRVAAITGAIGHGLLAVGAAATAANGRESLDALFPLGILVLLVGYGTLGVLDARQRVQPPRAGLVLLLGYVAAIVTDTIGIGGGFMLAASWAAVAHVSARARETGLAKAPAPAIAGRRSIG